jgi:hypothetical protein
MKDVEGCTEKLEADVALNVVLEGIIQAVKA